MKPIEYIKTLIRMYGAIESAFIVFLFVVGLIQCIALLTLV